MLCLTRILGSKFSWHGVHLLVLLFLISRLHLYLRLYQHLIVLQINGDKDKEAVLVDVTTAMEMLLTGQSLQQPSSQSESWSNEEQRASEDEPSNQSAQPVHVYDPSNPVTVRENL